jgi:hypothetical protein
VRAYRAGIALLALSQIVTFVFVLRRYVVGSQSWVSMLTAPKWQPPASWIGLTALFVLAIAAATALLFLASRRGSDFLEAIATCDDRN